MRICLLLVAAAAFLSLVLLPGAEGRGGGGRGRDRWRNRYKKEVANGGVAIPFRPSARDRATSQPSEESFVSTSRDGMDVLMGTTTRRDRKQKKKRRRRRQKKRRRQRQEEKKDATMQMQPEGEDDPDLDLSDSGRRRLPPFSSPSREDRRGREGEEDAGSGATNGGDGENGEGGGGAEPPSANLLAPEASSPSSNEDRHEKEEEEEENRLNPFASKATPASSSLDDDAGDAMTSVIEMSAMSANLVSANSAAAIDAALLASEDVEEEEASNNASQDGDSNDSNATMHLPPPPPSQPQTESEEDSLARRPPVKIMASNETMLLLLSISEEEDSNPKANSSSESTPPPGQCFCPCDEVASIPFILRRAPDTLEAPQAGGEGGQASNETASSQDEEDASEAPTGLEAPRDGRQQNLSDEDDEDDDSPAGSDLARATFQRYFDRLRTIYELDVRMLEQLATLLRNTNEEVIPALRQALTPLLSSLPASNLDPVALLGLAAMTAQRAEFEASASTKLGNLDFINIGPLPLNLGAGLDLIDDPATLRQFSQLLVAQFDESGLSFPISALLVGPRALATLAGGRSKRRNNALVTDILASKLREFLALGAGIRATLAVRNGEVVVDTFAPPQKIIKKCKITAETGPTHAVVRVKRNSVLRAAASISGGGGGPNTGYGVPATYGVPASASGSRNNSSGGSTEGNFFEEAGKNLKEALRDVRTSVFLGGDLEVALAAKAEVKARIGKDFFGRCFTKYRNTFPLQIYSSGKVWVGARVAASDVRVEDRPKRTPLGSSFGGSSSYSRPSTQPSFETQKVLVFKLDIKLSARIVSWSLDHVGIYNCDLKFFGVRVYSLCPLVKKAMRDFTRKFAGEFSSVHMPELLRRVEDLLRARVGQEVEIPLLLAEEKEELVVTMLRKAGEVARLKGDLVQDLREVAGRLAPLAQQVAPLAGQVVGQAAQLAGQAGPIVGAVVEQVAPLAGQVVGQVAPIAGAVAGQVGAAVADQLG